MIPQKTGFRTRNANTAITEYYNLTIDANASYILNNGEWLIFNQCRSNYGVQIEFSGNGSLLLVNCTFYYTLYHDFLDIVIINSTVAYNEVDRLCQVLVTKSTFQHYIADDNVTTKIFHSNAQYIYTSSPPDSSRYRWSLVEAGWWATIIMMGDESEILVDGRATGFPAGIIWFIRNPWESEDPQVPILDGNVSMMFYIEGFNRHPDITSENISVQLYVDEALVRKIDVVSNNEHWNWEIPSWLDIPKYPLGLHTLKVLVNDSQAQNWIYLPVEFANIHQISPPVFTYPHTKWAKLHGTVPITWQPSLDSHGHDLSYSLSVLRLGYAWQLLAENLTKATYEWDTTPYPYDVYQLKVVARCSEGLLIQSELSPLFTIENVGNGTASSTTLPPSSPWPEWTIRLGLMLGILVVLFVSLYVAKKR